MTLTPARKASDVEFYEGQIEVLARRLGRGEITTAEYVATRSHIQEMMDEAMAAGAEG
jgi:uncharacterized membrane protein